MKMTGLLLLAMTAALCGCAARPADERPLYRIPAGDMRNQALDRYRWLNQGKGLNPPAERTNADSPPR